MKRATLVLLLLVVCAACSSAEEAAPVAAEILPPAEIAEEITYEPDPAGFIIIHPTGYVAEIFHGPLNSPALDYEPEPEPEVLSVREWPEPTKIIALTFDDGPCKYTDDLLDILERYDVRVTFFVVGEMVEKGPETVRRAFDAGHEILGHSWDHSDHRRHSAAEVSRQIVETSAIIEYVTGVIPQPLFRVPFGHMNANIRRAAYERGYSVLNWTIDPRDWYYLCEEHIYEHIMERATDGSVVVLHDIHPSTVVAMEKVVPALRERGFEPVTATELIYQVYGGLSPGEQFRGRR